MDIEKELQKQLLNERETTEFRDSYNREINFYDMISSGNYDELVKVLKNIRSENQRQGILSSNELTNLKYHTIVMTALISRFCIEAGLDVAVSYSLSDIFIRKIDTATSVEEVSKLSNEIALDYCRRMRDSVKKAVVSRHVVLAIEYIRAHIQDNLSVENIADALGINPSYLSKLFKQEIGKTISHYIRDEKISIACNMLRHLDESSLSIANYLGFSSQSHFIQVFKKETGLTPEEYRKKNFHQSWMSED